MILNEDWYQTREELSEPSEQAISEGLKLLGIIKTAEYKREQGIPF